MKELTVEAKAENLDTVLTFFSTELPDVPDKLIGQILLAVEEIFVNIANYAYNADSGNAIIRLEKNDSITIEFEDSGIPFNPLAKTDPDITLSAEDRKIGGLGVFLVKKLMDSVDYRYENKCNILTMKKSI